VQTAQPRDPTELLRQLDSLVSSSLTPLPPSLIFPPLPQLIFGQERQRQLLQQRPLQQLSTPPPISSRRPQQLPFLPIPTWLLQRLLPPQLFLEPILLPTPLSSLHPLNVLWLLRELFRQQSSLASPTLQFSQLPQPLLSPFVPFLQPPSLGVLSPQLPPMPSTQPWFFPPLPLQVLPVPRQFFELPFLIPVVLVQPSINFQL